MRFVAGFVCGVLAVPAAAAVLLWSEKAEDLAMDVLNSEWVEGWWG